MKYGLIAGFGMSLWMLAEYFLGLHTTRLAISAYTTWGTEVILLTTLYFLLRHKLNNPSRHWLPVWEGALHSGLTSLVAGMLFCTFLNFYLRFINPEWPFHYRTWRAEEMRAAHESEEAIRHFVSSFDWSVTPLGLAFYAIGVYTLLGIVVSPFLTLWLNWRHKEPVNHG